MIFSKKNYPLIIVFLILGFILTLQFKSTLNRNAKNAERNSNTKQLIEQIEEEKSLQLKYSQEITELENQRYSIIASVIKDQPGDSTSEQIKRLKEVRLKGGLIDVYGPGVIIKLDDAVAGKTDNPGLLIIHDSDIKVLLNELKQAGAQAISINGERITAMSEQVCAGPTIRINKNRYSVPYIINVIGNTTDITRALENSERIKLMKRDGIRINIRTSDDVYINEYKGISGIDTMIDYLRGD